MSASNPIRLPHRNDIQGLRAVAVVLVILAHADFGWFAGGFVGVDVFFVLSGFLISGLLLQELRATGSINYFRFLGRRFRRLMPALLVMLGATYAAARELLTTFELHGQTASLAWAASWTSNFYFAYSEQDYFETSATEDLFLHTWSLGVEEQFYVLWPWLLLGAFALLSRSRQGDVSARSMLVLFGSVAVLGFAACMAWVESSAVQAFYLMPSRAWQFATGAFVYVLLHTAENEPDGRMRAELQRTAAAAMAAGLLLIIGSALVISPHERYPGLEAAFPTAGAALALLAGGSGASRPRMLLESRAVVWVGDRSYSLYLWHWPVFVLGSAYGLMDEMTNVALAVLLTVTVSAISYRYIEYPLWKGRFGSAPTRQTILTAAFGLTASVGLAVQMRQDLASQMPVAERTPSPRFDMPLFYRQPSCDTWYSSADIVPCGSGPDTAGKTVVFIGDSIGVQWASVLPELLPEPDWRTVVLTKSACPIVDEDYFYDRIGATYEICSTWRQAAIRFIEDVQPDLLFIGSSSHYAFTESQWVSGVERIIDTLRPAAADIVLVPGTPELSFDGISCVQAPSQFKFRLSGGTRDCEERMADANSAQVADYLRAVANRYQDVHVLTLDDLVCPNQLCAATTVNGTVVFRDRRHLTNTFVLESAATIRARLEHLGVLEPASGSRAASSGGTP